MSNPLKDLSRLDLGAAGAFPEEEPVTPQPEGFHEVERVSQVYEGELLGYHPNKPQVPESQAPARVFQESSSFLQEETEAAEDFQWSDLDEPADVDEEIELGITERPIVRGKVKGFYPVYNVLVSNHPVTKKEQLDLDPEPKVDRLKDPNDPGGQCIREFIEHVYRKKGALKVAAYMAGRLCVYRLSDALDNDLRTRTFKQEVLSGGLLGRNGVISNTHGVRFLGTGKAGSAKHPISFVQVGKAAEFIAGPGCYKVHFQDPEYPRYILDIPADIKKTDSVKAEVAAIEDPPVGKKLLQEVDAAIKNYVPEGPVSKDPITDEQLLTEEALDPDIVIMDIRSDSSRQEMPILDTPRTRLVRPLVTSVPYEYFAVQALWFDDISNRRLATAANPSISLYLVGAPPIVGANFSDWRLEELCGDYVLRYFNKARAEALSAKARAKAEAREDEDKIADEENGPEVDPEREPLKFFRKVKAEALLELRHTLGQTFSGPGLSISVGHVAAFDIGWNEKENKPKDRRLVINDEIIGHTMCTIGGSSGSLLFDPRLPLGCAVGVHTGPAGTPHPNKPITARMPWGTAKSFDNLQVRPPWNHAVAFTSPRAYIHSTKATLKSQLRPDDPYWLDPSSLGAQQLIPHSNYHEYFFFYLARMPADFLADPTVQAWIKHVAEKRTLSEQRLNRMTLTPSSEELDFLLAKARIKAQLGRILEVTCEPHQLSRELRERLRGPQRNTNIGKITDHMDANPEEHFDLSDWPFPFLELKSWDALRWLVGRLREPDSCTNYVPAAKLAQMMPPEKAPNPDQGEQGTVGYKEFLSEPEPNKLAGKNGSAEGAATSESAKDLD